MKNEKRSIEYLFQMKIDEHIGIYAVNDCPKRIQYHCKH